MYGTRCEITVLATGTFQDLSRRSNGLIDELAVVLPLVVDDDEKRRLEFLAE